MKKTDVESYKYGTRRPGVISRVILSVLGYEGTLAHKYIKRSKSKHRKTLRILMMPIIVFISVSTYASMMEKGNDAMTGGFDYNATIDLSWGFTQDFKDELIDFLLNRDDVKISVRNKLSAHGMLAMQNVPRNFFSDDFRQWHKDRTDSFNCDGFGTISIRYGLKLIAMKDEEFYSKVSKVSSETQGILLNFSGNTYIRGKVDSFKPFRMTPGEYVLVARHGGMEMTVDVGLILAAEMSAPPESIEPYFWDGNINILIPESVFYQWASMYFNYDIMTSIFIWVEDIDALNTDLKVNFSFGENGYLQAFDIDRYKGTTVLFKNIGYSISVASLLFAVVYYITVVKADFRNRHNEFFVLYSAGMSRNSLLKMLNTEIILYGIKSFIYGYIFGWLLSFVFYKWVRSGEPYPFRTPLIAFAITIVSVLLLILIIMICNRRNLHKLGTFNRL